MHASTLRAAGRRRGSCSIPPCSPSLAGWLGSGSAASSKRAGKCNRKPTLSVWGGVGGGCQSFGVSTTVVAVVHKKAKRNESPKAKPDSRSLGRCGDIVV